MKKWFPWLAGLAVIAALPDLGVMGVKIFTHQYDILFEAYLLLGCFPALHCNAMFFIVFLPANVRIAADCG